MIAQIEDNRVAAILREALPDLLAIYRFGSTATGLVVRESDLDLAVLPAAPLDPVRRWNLQEHLAMSLHVPVDLVDLLAASTVMRMQVLQTSILLFESDRAARDRFETAVYSSYARLNEERREILEQVKQEGAVYG